MIRDAVRADMADLIAMGRKFHSASGIGDIVAFDAPSFRQTMRDLMTRPNGILLVLENNGRVEGMAGALLYPFWFNHRHRTGQEIVWWVEPGARGEEAVELRRTMERRADASSFSMIALDGQRDEALARMYRAEGYRPMERIFIKRL